MVAAALGHGSFTMTASHYAQPEAISSARTTRLEQALGPDLSATVATLSADQLLAWLPAETLADLIDKGHKRQPNVPRYRRSGALFFTKTACLI